MVLTRLSFVVLCALSPISRSLLSPLSPSISASHARSRCTIAAQAGDGDDIGDSTDGVGTIVPRVLHQELSDSYMSYAMSVIMSRALPDVRDGLKPVHRRILYAMNELNLQPSGPHRKCARVVGEVLGKYHPHGDSSVYDALVRMAQDFSLRAPLVDGHGNFGSIDPDPAAAMRYTECKLAPLARDALLADVAEATVDFTDNFDGSELEPIVLPAKLPMLLLNGATGIAVGMATNCPPHNLGELVDALQLLLGDRAVSDEKLFAVVPAPDFPTGGIVMGTSGAQQMYATGRGSIVIRAAAHVEPASRGGGRESVVVTELPYGVAKNRLLENVAALVNEKKLDGIAEIRDESSMEGVRIVFEIKRDSEPVVVLNNMYKRTPLQNSFAGNMMAVVGAGRMPEQLTLRSALCAFLDFRVECLERRCRHRLSRAEARLHVVEGLLLALDGMDEVVRMIRAAPNGSEARAALESSFSLSGVQADAILGMQLRRLTALERTSLSDEAARLGASAAELRALLLERAKIEALISAELAELKSSYATPRRSKLGAASDAELEELDLTANEPCILIRSHKGYVKRLPLDEFDAQQRGTRGKAGTNLRDGDAVVQMEDCMTHDVLLWLSDAGVAYALPAYKVPEMSRTSRGVNARQLLPISEDERIATVLPVASFTDDRFMLLLTRNGWIKKTPLKAFERITARGLIAVSLAEDDDLVRASLCDQRDAVLLCSAKGQAILFDASEDQLRASGRQSRGVKSMRMGERDEIADMYVVQGGMEVHEGTHDGGVEAETQQLVAVTQYGFGKRIGLRNFRTQKRGGKGVIAMKFKRPDDRLLALTPTLHPDEEQLLLITQQGTIVRQRLSAIAEQSRATTGVKLQKLDAEDLVASVSIVSADETMDDDETADGDVTTDEADHATDLPPQYGS